MSGFKPVLTKKYKRYGKVYHSQLTEFEVKIVPQQEITIRQALSEEVRLKWDFIGERKFRVGDWAEYDSWNLNYLGQIVAITNKTVTIVDYPDSHNPCKKRLDLHTFCWRNFSKSVEEKRAANAETRMYI
ncbi:MAG TPA: hypothetical protein EYF95_08385 [Flavobacteriales bacterium]|jgi:hypothetical protein|nr:hypothetical protein [Flavobacteriales bacterium]